MIANIVVKCIIYNKKLNRFLLLQRFSRDEVGANTWENIGGNVEAGELPEEALRREIREETGITDIRIDRISYIAFLKGNPPDMLLVYFGETNTEKVSLSEEHQDYVWADEKKCRALLPKEILDDFENNNIFDILGLKISLEDTEWPLEYIDHDRRIARGIVYDDEGKFYFVRAERDDAFGKATTIETAGGGVETGEDLLRAIRRELNEELGVEVEVVQKIGVVSDYYNIIHRHNINNYFLCKVVSFGDKHLTEAEIESFHLSTLKLTYDEAVAEYEKRRETRLGRLVANRELPVLRRAKEIIAKSGENNGI